MKIVVCVKQVPDTAARIRIQASGRGVETAGLGYVVNPYDEYAVEESLRIRERAGGEVVVVSMGPDRIVEALRTCLAMGADRAVHLKDPLFDAADPYVTARLLAEAVSSMEYDLILCGKEAVDDNAGFVGPALAEFLGIPQATVVTKVELLDGGGGLRVEREVEGGKEVLELSLPVLLTAQKGLNEPRYASLPGIMKAKKKEVRVLDASALGLGGGLEGDFAPREEVLSLAPPPERKAGRILPGEPAEAVRDLVRLLREEAKAL